jgi:hypothetical protein
MIAPISVGAKYLFFVLLKAQELAAQGFPATPNAVDLRVQFVEGNAKTGMWLWETLRLENPLASAQGAEFLGRPFSRKHAVPRVFFGLAVFTIATRTPHPPGKMVSKSDRLRIPEWNRNVG